MAVAQAAATAFGDLLRRHRLAAGLTQEALAERAGLSVHGIQKLERGGSRPYRDTTNRLAKALPLDPEDLLVFQAAAQPAPRRRLPVAVDPTAEATSDLPAPLSSFVGRERDKDEIAQSLRATRLLTLTGVGGCGKTRLALEVSRSIRTDYPDGIRFVELAAIAEPSLVPQAVATAVGIREVPTQPLLTTLVGAIRQRRMVLVLDNCEHLLDSCARLADSLLRACPELRILATSRQPLAVDGEITRRVPSLALPPQQAPPTPETIVQYAATQLFVDRARAVSQEFAITSGNAAAIAVVCNRLDGIPLGRSYGPGFLRVGQARPGGGGTRSRASWLGAWRRASSRRRLGAISHTSR